MTQGQLDDLEGSWLRLGRDTVSRDTVVVDRLAVLEAPRGNEGPFILRTLVSKDSVPEDPGAKPDHDDPPCIQEAGPSWNLPS